MSSLRHDLDARDHQRRHGALGLQHFAQHAIDAKADDQAVFVWLDVNVRAVFLHRLREQGVDQSNDRRLVVTFEQIRSFGNAFGKMRKVGVVIQTFEHLHGNARAGFVGYAQQAVELRHRHACDFQRHPDEAANFGQALCAHADAAHDIGVAVRAAAHQHAMTFGERKRELALNRLL